MSTIIKKGDYTFICRWRSNRSGFVHEVELFNINDYCLSTAKAQYYNRTWERYEYQSCMQSAVQNAMDNRKEEIKEYIIHKIGSVRTKIGKDTLNKAVESDTNLLSLVELLFLL